MYARRVLIFAALFLIAHPAFGRPIMQHRIAANALSGRLAFGSPLGSPTSADAEKNWFGKVDLVEKTGRRSIRFFERGEGLSLFARGDFKLILLSGFFTKAHMSVGYRSIVCPDGITGACGTVDYVSVEMGNNF
jgi:hypothetical protein